MRTQTTPATTTVELNAEAIAKLRAAMRVFNDTAEAFIDEWLLTIVEENSGTIESFLDIKDPVELSKMEAKLARIWKGDKRLVRPEPSNVHFVTTAQNANRIERLAAQLGMDRDGLTNALLDCGIRELDNELAMGCETLEPNLVDDYDATSELDAMPLADILAADKAGPGYIQRQLYVRDCISNESLPSGNPAEGEKLPEAMAKRLR